MPARAVRRVAAGDLLEMHRGSRRMARFHTKRHTHDHRGKPSPLRLPQQRLGTLRHDRLEALHIHVQNSHAWPGPVLLHSLRASPLYVSQPRTNAASNRIAYFRRATDAPRATSACNRHRNRHRSRHRSRHRNRHRNRHHNRHRQPMPKRICPSLQASAPRRLPLAVERLPLTRERAIRYVSEWHPHPFSASAA